MSTNPIPRLPPATAEPFLEVTSFLEVTYNVRGAIPKGKSYEGKLNVKKQGAGYSFEWNAGNKFTGFGIRGANMVAVGMAGSR